MAALWSTAAVASWRNATPATRGVLHPGRTVAVAHLAHHRDIAPVLAPYIEHYWSVRWELGDGPPFRSEVLASPAVNLSVETGDRDRFGLALPAVLVHGPVTRRFVLDLDGWGRVTAARFQLGGFAALTGEAPLRDRVTPLAGEIGRPARTVLAAVVAHDDDAGRAAALDALLAERAPDPPAAYLELCALLARLRRDRALGRVEDLARDAGVSVRSLQRLFAAFVGVTPKAVLVRYRLQDVLAALDDGEQDLAALAAGLGWSDQAHLSRDFRAAVGVTPSAYARRARQDRALSGGR